MTESVDNQEFSSEREIVAALTSTFSEARAEVDKITGSTVRTRPQYLKRLSSVCSSAEREAKSLCESGSDEIPEQTDALAIWDLTQPGSLTPLVQHHVPAPRGWWTLVPVVIAWTFLGAAEFWYRGQVRADPELAAAGFFAVWIDGPFVLGPTMMAIIIVVTVISIMRQYAKFSRELARADRIDAVVDELERKVRPLVRKLRGLVLARRRLADTGDDADLRAAASALSGAAFYFETAVRGAGDFLSATASLQQLGPTIATQVENLVRAVERSESAAEGFGTGARQVAAAVAESRESAIEAAESAMMTATRLDGVDDAVATANEAVTLAVRHADAAARANEPLQQIIESLRESAELLRTTAQAIGKSTATLAETTDRLGWAISVADGLNREPPGRHMRSGEPL